MTGTLFYYASWPPDAIVNDWIVAAGGVMPNGTTATKVLWRVSRRWGRSVVIRGARLDSPGSFVQRFPWASGGYDFPSIVNVPAPGCWRLDVHVGRAGGALVVRVLAGG